MFSVNDLKYTRYKKDSKVNGRIPGTEESFTGRNIPEVILPLLGAFLNYKQSLKLTCGS